MTTLAIFAAAKNRIKSVFPTAVVEWRNGTFTCEALRSQRNQEAEIDPMTGRMDPDRMQVRCMVAECGDLENGKTVLVNQDAHTIVDIMPDSIGLTVVITLRRKRVAGT
jgi:hypothetical protein